jgi:2-polyprenyl-6-methoxyphenol hydroxylase-like FAD-dependent oxidoreductase
MKLTSREVLISGASVAGPTLAWWLGLTADPSNRFG